MPDPISTATSLFGILRQILFWGGTAKRAFKRRDPTVVLKKRLKWNKIIRERLMEAHKENLGLDIFVHDMDRFDQYPNFQETWFQKIKSKLFGPRIGPWFRCGLVGVGSQEVLLLLRWEGVKSAPNGEGLLHTSNSRIKGEPRTVGLIGFVPLEEIHEISWTGDDYYGHPHLYCYFHNAKGMPYSRISYCAKRDRPGLWAYYEELEDFYSVEKRTNWYKPYIDGAF